eukprot:1158520-Pelagomonas_calceolata.AAC.1
MAYACRQNRWQSGPAPKPPSSVQKLGLAYKGAASTAVQSLFQAQAGARVRGNPLLLFTRHHPAQNGSRKSVIWVTRLIRGWPSIGKYGKVGTTQRRLAWLLRDGI